MTQHLKGKVAIVTGSGQGIGKGIALFLAQEGAKVITNNRKPLNRKKLSEEGKNLSEPERKKMIALRGDAETTAEEIRRDGGEAFPFFGDVSDYDTAGRLVETAIDRFGRIDILVNNAAGLGRGTIIDTDEASWDYQTQAKMKGAYNTMHHAVPHMIKDGGTILNCASSAWTGLANLSAYSAGNAGVVGLSQSAAKELAQYNINVNVYCPQASSPGHIVEFNNAVKTLAKALGGEELSEEKRQKIEAEHGDPIGIGPLLAYLCTDQARDISGVVFGVTGAGKIEIYSEPLVTKRLQKSGGFWTVDKLSEIMPGTILEEYKSIEERDDWKNGGAGVEMVSRKINDDICFDHEAPASHFDADGVPRTVFARGEQTDGFYGKAYLNMLLGFGHESGCSLGNVSFGPGAHNNWHTHHGWQILIATAGKGWVQKQGKTPEKIKAGDVVVIEPGVCHWHGAAIDCGFSHIGMIINETAPTESGPDLTTDEYEEIVYVAEAESASK